MGNEYHINSILRAIEILERFDHERAEIGITEMARELHLYKSTVHRIVSTLETKNILEKNSKTGKYKLGLNLYKLGILARDENALIAVCAPRLAKLTEATGETSNLVIQDGNMIMYAAQEQSQRMVRMFAKLGARVFPHCSAAGKVLLADMEEASRDAIIDATGLPRYTPTTVTDKAKLVEELAWVRQEGYALDREERENGVICIAAPIRNSGGETVAAVSISGPKDRLNQDVRPEMISAVKQAAREISAELGCRAMTRK